MTDYDETTNRFDQAGDVLEPDALLASQFFDRVGGRAQPEGERRLMAAILEDAIRCLQRGAVAEKPGQRAQFREAKKWIRSTDESWFFSFENVCQTLGVDADVLRRRLLASDRRADGGETHNTAPEPPTGETACAGVG